MLGSVLPGESVVPRTDMMTQWSAWYWVHNLGEQRQA